MPLFRGTRFYNFDDLGVGMTFVLVNTKGLCWFSVHEIAKDFKVSSSLEF